MWLLLVTAEKGCRKVSRLSWKSKTYLGVCHRHSLFTNGKKKKKLRCCGCLRFILKENLLMFTHNTTERKTIKSELNHTTSKYSWPATLLTRTIVGCVHVKKNSFSPSKGGNDHITDLGVFTNYQDHWTCRPALGKLLELLFTNREMILHFQSFSREF